MHVGQVIAALPRPIANSHCDFHREVNCLSAGVNRTVGQRYQKHADPPSASISSGFSRHASEQNFPILLLRPGKMEYFARADSAGQKRNFTGTNGTALGHWASYGWDGTS